jgi:hypothetical protein
MTLAGAGGEAAGETLPWRMQESLRPIWNGIVLCAQAAQLLENFCGCWNLGWVSNGGVFYRGLEGRVEG